MKIGFLIPAYQAGKLLGAVLTDLEAQLAAASLSAPILVVDDGSTDETAQVAKRPSVTLISHSENRGKGAALVTGMQAALKVGLTHVVTLDADGQHHAKDAVQLVALAEEHPQALILAVRDMKNSGAPLKNQRSNAFSNRVLSLFGGAPLQDTQCGLRVYPIQDVLTLGAKHSGYAFESDVVLRAARRGLPIVHTPCAVIYPPEDQRLTHFDSFKDPARIVWQVIKTSLFVTHHRWGRRWFKRLAAALVVLAVGVCFTHLLIRRAGAITPPAILVKQLPRSDDGRLRRVGHSSAIFRQSIWEVQLKGTPEEIGWAHAQLMAAEMRENEGVLLGAFSHYVPSQTLRSLLLDTAVWNYRGIDQGMSDARKRELGAQALGFNPDPFQDFFPTYQRFVYLSALYDISLSFEYSPLIGCTTFTVSPERSATGGPLLARAFDFEVDDIFDTGKAVFFVHEDGLLPFVSVAWPGLVGVVSGMNEAGVAVVVHGARAGVTTTRGVPVVHALRRVLGEATTTSQAIAIFNSQESLVSHIVVINDREGHSVALERVPHHPGHVRELGPAAAVSNHLEGPFASDSKNQRVLASTSTVQRRTRADALLREQAGAIGPKTLVSWLRDRKAADGSPLAPGDRNAIDALIATHAVVMDTQSLDLWVSQGPHLLGGFVRYQLKNIFETGQLLPVSQDHETLPPDPNAPNLHH